MSETLYTLDEVRHTVKVVAERLKDRWLTAHVYDDGTRLEVGGAKLIDCYESEIDIDSGRRYRLRRWEPLCCIDVEHGSSMDDLVDHVYGRAVDASHTRGMAMSGGRSVRVEGTPIESAMHDALSAINAYVKLVKPTGGPPLLTWTIGSRGKVLGQGLTGEPVVLDPDGDVLGVVRRDHAVADAVVLVRDFMGRAHLPQQTPQAPDPDPCMAQLTEFRDDLRDALEAPTASMAELVAMVKAATKVLDVAAVKPGKLSERILMLRQQVADAEALAAVSASKAAHHQGVIEDIDKALTDASVGFVDCDVRIRVGAALAQLP
jgi:hypothetical protein